MGSPHNFSEAELELLRALYPTTSTAEVARRLGCTVKQVYNAADRYKIFKAGYEGERRKANRTRRPAVRPEATAGIAAISLDLPTWLAPQPLRTSATPEWVTSATRHVCMGPA